MKRTFSLKQFFIMIVAVLTVMMLAVPFAIAGNCGQCHIGDGSAAVIKSEGQILEAAGIVTGQAEDMIISEHFSGKDVIVYSATAEPNHILTTDAAIFSPVEQGPMAQAYPSYLPMATGISVLKMPGLAVIGMIEEAGLAHRIEMTRMASAASEEGQYDIHAAEMTQPLGGGLKTLMCAAADFQGILDAGQLFADEAGDSAQCMIVLSINCQDNKAARTAYLADSLAA